MWNKLKKIILPVVLGFCIFSLAETSVLTENYSDVYSNNLSITTQGGNIQIKPIEPKSADEFFGLAINKYRGAITFVSGMGAIAMIMFFILNFIKLGGSQGNPQERRKAVTGLIVSGIATACLGSVGLVVGLFFNML